MATDPKDTIYIDPEDEITTVIDKVSASHKKLIALVLPSRATVFQSIVNMKLLKRKSGEAGKDIVLVTNESSLMPLAGAVGLHVAKTLSSKPEIPVAPVINAAMIEAAEDEKIAGDLEPSEEEDLKKLGKEEIAKKSAVKDLASDSGPIELDNTEEDDTKPTDTAMPAVPLSSGKKEDKKKKKLKVPNFERFRVIAALGCLGIVGLIVLWILLFSVWPHATINIKTNAQNVSATASFILDPSASSLNQSSGNVPAKLVSETKTYTATVNASGQQNNGQVATGTVMMTASEICPPSFPTPPNVPAGSEVVQNNLAYITQGATTFTSSYDAKTKCYSFTATSSTQIVAQNPGSNYNAPANTAFSVPDYSGVTATGSASGGTDDIITIVAAADISNAENKISTNSTGAKSDLTGNLNQANYYPIDATFVSGTPSISPNASAGTAASSVTVTETIKYTMYGANKQDLMTLLDSNIKSQVNKDQNILNDGFSSANYSLGSSPTNVTMTSNAIVGPNISAAALKKEVKGLKAGAIEALIKNNQNVSSVTVDLSPFYVSTAPSASHITINIAKPTNSPSNASQ